MKYQCAICALNYLNSDFMKKINYEPQIEMVELGTQTPSFAPLNSDLDLVMN